MSSFNPTQTRSVDPFASYNSDTVNALTRMVTDGNNALFSPRAMDVIADSTAPNDYVIVTTGIAFMDNVLIEITANHSVDFNAASHYFGGAVVKEPGNYYIVLDYNFVRSRPAPEAAVKILTPSEVSGGSFGANHLLLKVVQATTGPWSINALLDYNPSIPADERINTSEWASVENTLPTFTQSRDWGRIVYIRNEDAFYFGLVNAWESLQEAGTRFNINTTGTSIGQLCYSDSTGEAQAAISTSMLTLASFITVQVGTNDGRSRLIGKVEDVTVESGITMVAGDYAYLSATEAGTITNVQPATIYQHVGTALTGGTGTIDLLFLPGPVVFTSLTVGGGNIGVPGDPDLIQLSINQVIINGKLIVEMDTGGVYDNTTVAAIFGDSTGADSAYIIGETINGGYNEESDVSALRLNYRGHQAGIGYNRDLVIYDGKGNQIAKFTGSNGHFQLPNGTTINEFSIDGTLAGNSDDAVPTEKASKTYIDASIATALSASRANGHIVRSQYEYKDADEIYIYGGEAMVKDKYVSWAATLTKAFSGMNGSSWYYCYLDYSVLTDGDTVVAADIIYSTTAPIWNATYNQLMNGDDRCIFAVKSIGAAAIREFFHDGDVTAYADEIVDRSFADLDTAWVDVLLTIPAFCRSAFVTFGAAMAAGPTDAHSYWRTNGQSGATGHMVCHTNPEGGLDVDVSRVVTDSNLRIEVRNDTSGTNGLGVNTHGWYFPIGM